MALRRLLLLIPDHGPTHERKRKKYAFMEEEMTVFSSTSDVVKEVASSIKESKNGDIHLSF